MDTLRLSDDGQRRLEAAQTEAEALRALSELAVLLGVEERGRWWAAGELAARLQRFEAAAWPRIRRGGREPRNRAEALLAALCRSELPRSRDRIYKLLGH